MEWIVVEATTFSAAREALLDRLGVDEAEAEFEMLSESSPKLLGLRKARVRVRARVAPRPPSDTGRSRFRKGKEIRPRKASSRHAGSTQAKSSGKSPSEFSRKNRQNPSRDKAISEKKRKQMKETPDRDRMAEDEQESIACSFVEGAVKFFDPEAEVIAKYKDGALHLNVEGDDLGNLIGPRGSALDALEELLMVCLRRRAQGRRYAQVRLDVGGYRQFRRERLEMFARQVAEEVCTTREPVAFEPMRSLDRKIIHDAVLKVDGVKTRSEGEDPMRRVVVSPE